MTRRTRRLIFYSLIGVFLALGSAVILYAQGWRLDLTNWQFQKVGGIYVRSFPAETKIYLSGGPVNNSRGFLTAGTFISNLFPGTYKLKLTAPGYRDWQETVAVKPSLVTEIKNVVLIPQVPELVSTSTVKNFWILNQELATQNGRSEILWENQKLAGSQIIGWSNDFKKILTIDKTQENYFLNDISNREVDAVNLNSLLEDVGLPVYQSSWQPHLDANDSNLIIIQTPHSLLKLDLTANTLSTLATTTSQFPSWSSSSNWFGWITFDSSKNISKLALYDKVLDARRTAMVLPGKTLKLEFLDNVQIGLLQNNGNFYLYNISGDRTDHLASNVKDFYFSPKRNFAAFTKKDGVELLSLTDKNESWRFPLSDSISGLEWYNDEAHLFVFYPGEIKFLDILDKTLGNFPVLVSTVSGHYDIQSNVFYFIKDKNLWRLNFPK